MYIILTVVVRIDAKDITKYRWQKGEDTTRMDTEKEVSNYYAILNRITLQCVYHHGYSYNYINKLILWKKNQWKKKTTEI